MWVRSVRVFAERAPSASGPGDDVAPCRVVSGIWPSAADRGLLWLLRLTGQTGGSSWPARLYAATLYIVLVGTSTASAVTMAMQGVAAITSGRSFLQAAFSSFFFGLSHSLILAPVTSTLVCGRRRYAALLCGVQSLIEDAAREIESQPICQRLRNRVTVLLGVTTATLLAISVVQVLLPYSVMAKTCADSRMGCVIALSSNALLITTITSVLLIPIKFLYMTLLLSEGFRAVDAELQTLARHGDLKDWVRLARLRGLQDRLSTSFSRLVADMTPELIPILLAGITSMVISFLVLFQSSAADSDDFHMPSLLFYMLVAVVLLIGVPCEAGQHVLDLAAATRGSLLRLHWETPRVGQEVSMLQEAVRRDLEHLGDLGYCRLQRSTMVSITSTVITYIIVFVQFRMSET